MIVLPGRVVHFGDKKIHCSNSGLIKKELPGFSRTLLRGNSALSLYADCKRIFDINPNAEVRSILSV